MAAAKVQQPEHVFSENWPADRVERWPIEDLIPYAQNARRHSDEQIEQIARSVQEFGFTAPILVAEDGTIIAGHGRVLAAKVLGLVEVPVMVARGWSDAKRRAYTILDNRLAENSSWDEDLLRVEIEQLMADDFDTSVLGWSEEELAELTKAAAETAPPAEFPSFGEDIETEHQCPKCGYRWSGKAS